MTSDERNQLEWLATHLGPGDSRSAAIRAALAEVDALTQQVADLEARAIPKAWVESDHLIVSATFEDRAECVAVGRHIEGAWFAVTADAVSGGRTFPTLAAALSAAKEAP